MAIKNRTKIPDTILLDSGANQHAGGNPDLFVDMRPHCEDIVTAQETIPTTLIGTVKTISQNGTELLLRQCVH